jgi:hypothetical protein
VNCGIITTLSCMYLAMGLVPLFDYPNTLLRNGGIPAASADTWRAWARVVIASDGSFMGSPPPSSAEGGQGSSESQVRTNAPCSPRWLADNYASKGAAKAGGPFLPELGKTALEKAGKRPKKK